KIRPQIVAELANKGLGRAVNISARIWPFARRGADVDDVPAIPLNHTGQQQPRAVDQAFDVAVDHGVPVVQIRALRWIEPDRTTGIVDQNINRPKRRRQRCYRLLNLTAPANIEG